MANNVCMGVKEVFVISARKVYIDEEALPEWTTKSEI
jgi:hypothetical protein